jgi:hypothetical protein
MDAVIGLVGAVVGGALVLVGDVYTRRFERRSARLERLQAAAADVLATYLDARGAVITAYRAGSSLAQETLYPHERSVALARLYTTPGSERLLGLFDQLAAANHAVVDAVDSGDADLVQTRLASQLEAIRAVEARVRDLLTDGPHRQE